MIVQPGRDRHRTRRFLFQSVLWLGIVASVPTNALAQTRSVCGEIRDDRGEPVPGALVQDVTDAGSAIGLALAPIEVRADANGGFCIGGGVTRLRVTAPGWAPALVRVEGQSRLIVRLVVRAVVLEGRVLDDRRRPVVGAAVRVVDEGEGGGFGFPSDDPEYADGQGRFRIDGLGPGSYTLVVTAEGHRRAVRERVRLQPVADRSVVLEVQMDDAVVVTGIVRTEGGVPVADARVTVATLTDARAGSVVTNPDGAFEVGDLPRASSYVVTAITQDGQESSLSVECGDDTRRCGPASITVGPRPFLRARLVRPDGSPYAGAAKVWLGDVSTDWITIADGALRVALPPATGPLEIMTAGYRVTRIPAVTIRAAEPHDLGEIKLDRGLTVRGHVAGLDGRPLAGVAVAAVGSRTTSAADGSFELGGFEPDENVDVVFSLPGYFPGEVKGVRPGAAGVAATLARTAAVLGRLVTGTPPRPIDDFDVDVFSEWAPGGERQPRSDRADAVLASGLPPAEITLQIRAPGFVPRWFAGLRLRPGERRDLGEINLTPAAVLRGAVLDDRSGAPLRDAALTLGGAFDREARTGEDGRFALPDVVPGQHDLTIVADGHAHVTRTVTATLDGPEVVLRVGGLGTIEGLVRDRDGQPCVGCPVTVREFGNMDRELVTDSSGRFRREKLQPGRYLVSSSGAAHGEQTAHGFAPDTPFAETTRRWVDVVPDEVASVEIGEPTAKIRVSGKVQAGGPPVPATLTWLPAGTGLALASRTQTDAEGAYAIDLERPGSYRVVFGGEVSGREDQGAALSVTVGPESAQRIDLDVRRVTVTGRVVGAATGAPVAGAVVVARLTVPMLDLSSAPAGRTTTDDDGRFALQLVAGAHRLAVRAEGFAVTERENVKVEAGRELSLGKIPLRDGRPLRVRLLDDQGRPQRYSAATVSSERFTHDDGRADANGIVTLTDAPPGPVTVTTLGYAVGVKSGLEALPEDVDPPTITLTRGGALDVRVSDAGGGPAAGVLVHVLKDKLDITPVLQRFSSDSMFTSEEGTVHVRRLEPGEYEVLVRNGDRETRRRAVVQLGETREVGLTLE